MLKREDILNKLLDSIIENVNKNAREIGQKIPQKWRKEVTAKGAKLFNSAHFQYLVKGRGPGKQPPPAAMLKFVKSTPDALVKARRIWKKITEESLAYIIGRSIGEKGTLIFQGKKQGIDFDGAVKASVKEVFSSLPKSMAVDIQNAINKRR